MLTVSEVLTILEKEGLTTSRQVVVSPPWASSRILACCARNAKKRLAGISFRFGRIYCKEKSCSFRFRKEQPFLRLCCYQAALTTDIASGDGDLFLFRRNARIPIRLVDFKEKAFYLVH